MLTDDILQHVLEHLELQDIVHVMHTCRTFYASGVPFLLRDVDYVPAAKQTRWLLYRHFLRQNPSRFLYLRRLTCYYGDFLPLETSAGLFTDLLRQGTYLEHLDITFVASISATNNIIHYTPPRWLSSCHTAVIPPSYRGMTGQSTVWRNVINN